MGRIFYNNTVLVLLLRYLVLHDILVHDLVVKLKGVLVCKIIWQFSFLRFDNVRFLRTSCVMQFVVLVVAQVLGEDLLVVPSCILLRDQALGRALVAWQFSGVHIWNNSIELFVSGRFLRATSELKFSLLSHDSTELFLDRCGFSFKLFVTELIGRGWGTDVILADLNLLSFFISRGLGSWSFWLVSFIICNNVTGCQVLRGYLVFYLFYFSWWLLTSLSGRADGRHLTAPFSWDFFTWGIFNVDDVVTAKHRLKIPEEFASSFTFFTNGLACKVVTFDEPSGSVVDVLWHSILGNGLLYLDAVLYEMCLRDYFLYSIPFQLFIAKDNTNSLAHLFHSCGRFM